MKKSFEKWPKFDWYWAGPPIVGLMGGMDGVKGGQDSAIG